MTIVWPQHANEPSQEEIHNLSLRSLREGLEVPWLMPAHLYSASALCAPLAPLQYQLGFAYHSGAAAAPHHHHHHQPHHHPGASASAMAGLFPHHLHHLPYQLTLGPAAGAVPGALPPGAPSPEPAGPFSLRSSGNVSPTSKASSLVIFFT
ncbi:Telomerase-binding protein EST1A [Frankliniella fusca]|uniref:Telomerase-binding protein EST1A n=1 Tax=Frankliniella fusca TaxID=407009 RepID=A0AAE1LF02_9NEOP|nr:Telomerase-binding protein EST1A [Frankliniella fusca]